MSDTSLGSTRWADERLLRACLIADRLCEDRVPAAVRLERQLGGLGAPWLIIAPAGRRKSPERAERHPPHAAHGLAAA